MSRAFKLTALAAVLALSSIGIAKADCVEEDTPFGKFVYCFQVTQQSNNNNGGSVNQSNNAAQSASASQGD